MSTRQIRMINIIDLLGISDAIVQAFRTFFGYLAATIYSLIEYIYHVFELLGRAEIVNSDFIKGIYTKVGIILSLFMVFKLTFSLIQSLVDPDKLTDKKNGYGQIIFRCIISIVLLGTTPAIFKEAYNIQNSIVGSNENENVLYKLIAGSNKKGSTNKIGRELAADLYFDFFTETSEGILDNGMIDKIEASNSDYVDRFQTDNYDTLFENVSNGNSSFYSTIDYLTIKEGNEYVIDVNWIPLFGVGIFVLYMIVMYTIQIAVRVVQLAYLQLIAPIPILSYISDPDGTFKRWTKQCITTYLDLFIRLMIIYFVMTLMGNVLAEFNNAPDILYASTGLAGESFITKVLVKALIIIGLLLFAKKVPELLKDLFPNMGGGAASLGFGLGLKKNLLDPLKDVGKSLYNSPLGWGLKGGKKLGTYIDRKAHHLPKPRGKFGQAMDKWLPGRGEVIKQRRQAQEDERQFNRNMEQGEKMYKDFGDDLIVKDDQGNIVGIKNGVFSKKDYASSYLNLERAKAENKKAEQEYQTEYAKYQAAYSRGDQAAIKLAEERIKIAEGNKKAAQGKLELAQKRHDANKKIYTSDAQREETHDYYKKTHKKRSEYPNDTQPQDNTRTTSPTPSSASTSSPSSTASSPTRQNNQSVFGNISNGNDDGNPYENGHAQFTADSISESANNDNPYENPNYYNDNGNYRNSSNSNSEDDNPYTNPNYYNDNNQASNSNNDDEFDGSNYY